jgi:hypothetical protein
LIAAKTRITGDMLLLDPEGIDLPDNEAALRHAELLARGFKWDSVVDLC